MIKNILSVLLILLLGVSLGYTSPIQGKEDKGMILQLIGFEHYGVRMMLKNTTSAPVKFVNDPSFYVADMQIIDTQGHRFLPFDIRSIKDAAFNLTIASYKELKPGEEMVLWEGKFYPLGVKDHLYGFHCGPLSWEWLNNPALGASPGGALPPGAYKLKMTFENRFNTAHDKTGAIVTVPGVWVGEKSSNELDIDLK